MHQLPFLGILGKAQDMLVNFAWQAVREPEGDDLNDRTVVEMRKIAALEPPFVLRIAHARRLIRSHRRTLPQCSDFLSKRDLDTKKCRQDAGGPRKKHHPPVSLRRPAAFVS